MARIQKPGDNSFSADNFADDPIVVQCSSIGAGYTRCPNTVVVEYSLENLAEILEFANKGGGPLCEDCKRRRSQPKPGVMSSESED